MFCLLPNVPWADLRARALQCEALGFDLIGLADHFIDWTKPESDWFESWSVMGALAEATSTIRLTTLVSQIPLRNPAMLARQALTLDHVSGRANRGRAGDGADDRSLLRDDRDPELADWRASGAVRGVCPDRGIAAGQ